ncbi:MAG TPA: aspartate carbamoyltransferase regulatory subunit [Candidatus Nanoarchaeia archaeon]|nr:aspartate carbamoyltransferase regulatory subunit [Candidatus Nanoarchaeia archaeon]
MKEQKVPGIKDGTVIDHIPSSRTPKVLQILDLANIEDFVSIGMNLSSTKMKTKGIIKVANRKLSNEQLDKLAVIAPGATVNIIKDYQVKEKFKVNMKDRIQKVLRCPNPRCVTNVEKVSTIFEVQEKEPLQVRCRFCERAFGSNEIIIV